MCVPYMYMYVDMVNVKQRGYMQMTQIFVNLPHFRVTTKNIMTWMLTNVLLDVLSTHVLFHSYII